MRKRFNPFLIALATGCAGFGVSIVACGVDPKCADADPSAVVQVSGTYDYGGDTSLSLIGTITFEQQGDLVRVTDTTYLNSNDRPLQSEFAPLDGNTLVLKLTPKNGDTNYQADVTFRFSKGGEIFCVEFSDTNGDAGVLGSYHGAKK
jgi:hypothetical protein